MFLELQLTPKLDHEDELRVNNSAAGEKWWMVQVMLAKGYHAK